MAEINFAPYFKDEMTTVLKGKVISSIEIPDNGLDDFLIIHFLDETTLKLRYEQIYTWELIGKED